MNKLSNNYSKNIFNDISNLIVVNKRCMLIRNYFLKNSQLVRLKYTEELYMVLHEALSNGLKGINL
jgi:hypothetical protein